MRRKTKKLVYILSSSALAVVVFLAGLLFIRSNFEFASPQQQTSGGNTSIGNGEMGEDGVGTTDGIGSGTGDGGVGGSGGANTGTGEGSGSGSGDGPGGGSDGYGPESGGGGGVGEGGGGELEPMDPSENYLFRIRSDKTETVYLREENKGGYTGKGEHGFSGDYTYEVDSGDPDPNQFFANALSVSGYSSHYVDVELKADLLRLYPYYNNKIYESDVGIMQYRARTYAYQYNYSTMRRLSTISSYNKTWGNAEDEYYKFVKDNYLSVPNDLKQTLKKLAKENGLNANSSTIISEVAYYIQNAAYYDDFYANRNYPSDKDMVTCFLTEYKRGVCRHFAAAATMMFRTLGIPARYTIGFAVDVDADEWLVYGDDSGEVGHAWTEVYLENYGWVAIEVTGGNIAPPDDGEGEEPDNTGTDVIRVRTDSLKKVYDGTPLFQEPIISSTLIEGHTISVSYPSLTNVGSIPNKPTIRVYDANGKDCTAKANIIFNCGTLTVTPKEVTLTTGSKTASGVSSLSCQEYEITGLVEGDKLALSGIEFAKLTSPGVCSNTIRYQSLVITNQYGEDVTKNYSIKLRYGDLILLE